MASRSTGSGKPVSSSADFPSARPSLLERLVVAEVVARVSAETFLEIGLSCLRKGLPSDEASGGLVTGLMVSARPEY